MIILGPPADTCRICGGFNGLVIGDGPEPVCRECIGDSVNLANDPQIVALMTADDLTKMLADEAREDA